MIYNVVLAAGVQQSESVIHIHISTLFKDSFPRIGHYITTYIFIHKHMVILQKIKNNIYPLFVKILDYYFNAFKVTFKVSV